MLNEQDCRVLKVTKQEYLMRLLLKMPRFETENLRLSNRMQSYETTP